MKNLNEENAMLLEIYQKLNAPYPRKNGIACPTCGEELFDSDGMVLASSPPQRNIHCDCGYKGYRIY